MIKIIDYGLGNILAFQNSYKRLNIEIGIARTADDLTGATKLILPGVGAFDHAIELLDRSGMRGTLQKMVVDDRTPVLGICVGMQILALGSDEGKLPGLGWVRGRVRHFNALHRLKLQVPHMGWNDVTPRAGNSLFKDLEQQARFYFLHSYFFECENAADQAATSVYGESFCCAVQRQNIYGVQFHPEKSHHFGMQLLKNFAELGC